MKNYKIKISLVFFVAFFINACNDDFLERQPLDEISEDAFWNTENDLAVYNNSIYNRTLDDEEVPIIHGHSQRFDSHRHSIWYQDEFADNMAPTHGRHTRYQQVRSGRHNVPSSPEWFGYRDRGWEFVRAINVGLESYALAPVSQEVLDKYAGEARLLRGWFYADKVQRFGDVHWIDKALNIDSEELYDARTPRDQVMQNVLDDLNFATTKLPDDWGDGNAPGRLNRWCALLVKSRVCLFEGTWQKYHGGTAADIWLGHAADAAKELMDMGPYSIYDTGDPAHDYNAFHRIVDLSGNSEVMYWRKYETGVFEHHVQSYSRGYMGGMAKDLVDDYLCTDGAPITTSPLYQGNAQIEDVFVNRDPRLRQSILHPDDKDWYNYDAGDAHEYPRVNGMSGGRKSTTGYHIIKTYNAEQLIGKAYSQDISAAVVMRFAEALLNYAEAKAELGTITQGDLDISINLLRDRVEMPHLMMDVAMDPKYANDGVSALISEIRRERRVELFMEGFRYNDIKRWKQGKKLEVPTLGMLFDDAARARYEGANVKTTMYTDPVSGVTQEFIDVYQGSDWENPVFDEGKHYLWPIPLSVIAQIPEVKQNPGWGSD